MEKLRSETQDFKHMSLLLYFDPNNAWLKFDLGINQGFTSSTLLPNEYYGISYENHSKKLGLTTFTEIRRSGDSIQMYKILHRVVSDSTVDSLHVLRYPQQLLLLLINNPIIISKKCQYFENFESFMEIFLEKVAFSKNIIIFLTSNLRIFNTSNQIGIKSSFYSQLLTIYSSFFLSIHFPINLKSNI